MIATKSCSECGKTYEGRYNSRLCPACVAAHARKHRKACSARQHQTGVEIMQSIMNRPDDPPRQLRKPQQVTWWNVRTGQIEERWE